MTGIEFALFAGSNFMNIYMTTDYASDQLFWPNVVRAAGQALIKKLTQYFTSHGVVDHAEASHRAVLAIGQVVQKQAFILAFSDTFYLLGMALIAALMAALQLKKPNHLETGGTH